MEGASFSDGPPSAAMSAPGLPAATLAALPAVSTVAPIGAQPRWPVYTGLVFAHRFAHRARPDLVRIADTGQADNVDMRIPTSVILEGLAREAPRGDVSPEWIIGNLRERSFGIVMLVIALVGLVPGASPFVGILLAVPAIQMMLGHKGPVLPRRVATRRIPTARLVRLLERVIPVFRRMEKIVRPRWGTPFEATKRVVGLIVLLLGATLLAPIPFTHVIPILAIMLLAFAFLEEDGVLLCIALGMAAISVTITAAAVWGAVEAGRLL